MKEVLFEWSHYKIGKLEQRRRRRLRKGLLKSEFALLQTFSRLFHLTQFVKCWQIFLELNSKRLYEHSGKEKEGHCLVFKSSTKREIRHFQTRKGLFLPAVGPDYRPGHMLKTVIFKLNICVVF